MKEKFQHNHQDYNQCNQASHCNTEKTSNQTKAKVYNYKTLALVLAACLIATITWLIFNPGKPKIHSNNTTITLNHDNADDKACFKNDKICFNYPKTWRIIEQKNETDTQSVAHKLETFTLSSPSNNIKLEVVSGLNGIGLACPENEVIYIKDSTPTKLDYLPITSEQSSRAFIAKIVSHNNGYFYPDLIITASKWFEKPILPFKKNSCLITGEPNTKPMIANKALLYPQVDQHTPATHGLISISLSSYKSNSLEEAYSYLDSPELNQAYQIATSLHVAK